MCSVAESAIDNYRPRKRPADVVRGFDVSACTIGHGAGASNYCARHKFDHLARATFPCGCVPLEVIDLTKADPGPGYADMLRSL